MLRVETLKARRVPDRVKLGVPLAPPKQIRHVEVAALGEVFVGAGVARLAGVAVAAILGEGDVVGGQHPRQAPARALRARDVRYHVLPERVPPLPRLLKSVKDGFRV
jgi:hypothetical protein